MKKYKSIFSAIILLALVSCEAIIENDITNSAVDIIYPNEGAEILGNTVNFRWSVIEGADSYRLQILKGESNSRYILDSLVEGAYFSMNLDASIYQWRIRGENGAYSGQYSAFNDFTVVYSEDLSNQILELLTPGDDDFINSSEFYFNWKPLEAAESYSFRLIKQNNQGELTIEEITGLSDPFHTVESSKYSTDGKYLWEVKAQNETSETDFSSSSFYLDREAPLNAILLNPDDDKIFNVKTVSFQWANQDSSQDVEGNLKYILQISLDPDFNNFIENIEVSSLTKAITFDELGTYYWRVRVIDQAGNLSSFSEQRTVIID